MIKVLVADDEELEREAVSYMIAQELAGECILVGAAASGDEAVRLCCAQQPDLLFLDVRMPGMDGLEAAARIRAAGLTTRIVIASAYDDFQYAQRAIRLGVADYLLKPVQPDELLRQIRSVAVARAAVPGEALAQTFAADLLSDSPQHRAAWPAWAQQLGLPHIPDRAAYAVLNGPGEIAAKSHSVQLRRSDGLALLLPSGELPAVPGAFVGLGRRTGLSESLSEARQAAYLARAREDRRPLAYAQLSEPGRLVARVLIYLHEHYTDECSLESVARRFAVSLAHFSRIFSREVGTGFAGYLADLRVGEGARLLTETDWLIEQVAREAGFNSLHYFSAVFKRATGLSPTEFRVQSQLQERGETP